MSEKGISRRQFVTGAAVVAAATALPLAQGVSVAGAAPLTGLKTLDKTGQKLFVGSTIAWTPLDAKLLARKAYEIYKGKWADQSACCEASFWPIIGEFAAREEAAGLTPLTGNWLKIAKGLFNYGGGGINSWRSICGCTNAGANVIKLATGISGNIDEYLRWYEKTLLPTNATYVDYASGEWTPAGDSPTAAPSAGWGSATNQLAIPYNNAPKSKAGSVLCHASLTNWRIAGGQWEATHTGAQSERCGKLCYDSVYKQATMINAWMAGTTYAGTLDASYSSCGEGTGSACHGTTSGAYGNPYAQAKMKCDSCHEQVLGDNHNL